MYPGATPVWEQGPSEWLHPTSGTAFPAVLNKPPPYPLLKHASGIIYFPRSFPNEFFYALLILYMTVLFLFFYYEFLPT